MNMVGRGLLVQSWDYNVFEEYIGSSCGWSTASGRRIDKFRKVSGADRSTLGV